MNPIIFVFWTLFLTFAIWSLASYISYVIVVLITLLKENVYRIVMTVLLSLNTIFLILGSCISEFLENSIKVDFEFNIIGFMTMLLISSLIRIRCFLKKWRAFVIVLMVVNIVILYMALYEFSCRALSV